MTQDFLAMIVKNVGKNPKLQKVARKQLKRNQIRVRVKSCALNFSDLLMIRGKYQDTPSFPFTPGMEISGEVLEINSDVSNFQPGDPVLSFCGYGGLAEEITISASRCFKRPDHVDPIIGSVLPIAYGTSHLALARRANLKSCERLVVLGAGGGVGLTAVEIGAKLGAKVTAVARGIQKLNAAKAAGATTLIDSAETPDLREAILQNGPTQVIYDTVGGALGEAALRTLSPEGRHLLIGFASGDLPRLRPNHMLVKNVSVIGVNISGYMTFGPELFADSLNTLMALHKTGGISPHISHVLPLERTVEGLDILKNRAATGKIVITP